MQLATFKGHRVRTDASESLARLRKKYRNPLLGETERRDPPKQEAKSAAKLAQQTQTERKGRGKHESVDHSSGRLLFKRTAPLSSTCWPLASPHKRQVSDFFTYSSPAEGLALRCSEAGLSSKREEAKKFSESYSIRLQGVLEKKQKLESLSLATNLRRIDEAEL